MVTICYRVSPLKANPINKLGSKIVVITKNVPKPYPGEKGHKKLQRAIHKSYLRGVGQSKPTFKDEQT